MIRSITVGLPVGNVSTTLIESQAVEFFHVAGASLEAAGLESRTLRFTLPPQGVDAEMEGVIPSLLNWVDALAERVGIRWYCLPLDLVAEGPRRERLMTALMAISRHPRMFLNLIVADEKSMAVDAVYDAAELILKISKKSNNGFDNFRVGASCGCPPNTPFFPFSRHEGDELAFSFAMETTKAALDICDELGGEAPIDVFRDLLIERLAAILAETQGLGDEMAKKSGTVFRGIDASFAPFPDGQASVGRLVERLSGAPVGHHGSLFVTAVLTDCIRTAFARSGAKSAGFNGVMYSVLEDEVLASSMSRRHASLDGLIAMATVCACGVDMLPVPGDSFTEELASVIMDVAALSLALKKPLGARMLPIPGRSANEFTRFNLDFLCDSRISPLTPTDHSFRTEQGGFSLLTPRAGGLV